MDSGHDRELDEKCWIEMEKKRERERCIYRYSIEGVKSDAADMSKWDNRE